ncbi:MAG: MCE family protein [Actinomycetota bacterium]|nr:MCE family protein [Actinomycetota bacterium]
MTTAAVVDQRGRFSLEALTDSRLARAVFGLILSVAVVASVLFIVEAFTGKFTNVVDVEGQLPGKGNALPIGSLVLYRNVTVGMISKEGTGPNGTIAVTFKMYPAKAAQVPKNVQALVAPLSIFGNQAVDLDVPAGTMASTAPLAAGDMIPANTSVQSTSLQDTTKQFYNLLNAVHPADLSVALNAFATALRGEGKNLGQTFDLADNYLGLANTLLPTVQSDIGLLTPVAKSFNNAGPDLIGILGNGVTTGNAISANANALSGVLTNGSAAVGQLNTGLISQVQNSLPNLLNSSGPVLNDIASNPNLLRQTLDGLGKFSAAVAAEETHGPFLSINVNLPVSNTEAAVQAALGYVPPGQTISSELATALGSVFDPRPYTAADCPRFPGMQNNCATSNSAAAPRSGSVATQSSTLPGGTSSAGSTYAPGSPASPGTNAAVAARATSNPFASEVEAVQSIATAVGGGRAPSAPGVASVVLVPLYSSMAVSG